MLPIFLFRSGTGPQRARSRLPKQPTPLATVRVPPPLPRNDLPPPQRRTTPRSTCMPMEQRANGASRTARGQQTPITRFQGGQPGEDARPNSGAPHNGAGRPPRGRPPAIPTARDAGTQERTLWGWCWVPTPAPPTCAFEALERVSRDRSRRKIKLRAKDAPPAEIKRKIVFSDLRNPPNNFTPLFGEVAKYRTLTEKDEQ